MKALNRITIELFEQDARLVFLLLCLVQTLVMVIQQEFILVDEVYYNTYGEQLAMERIDELIAFGEEWAWVNFALVPLFVVLQAFLITVCLNVGTLFFNYDIGFKALFKMVLKAMIVFVFASLLMTFIQWQVIEVSTFQDLQNANFMSALWFFDQETLPVWLSYPISLISVYEIAFWVLLAAGVSYLLKQSFSESINFVASTYGVGLTVWILLIIFLQISVS